MRGRRGVRSVTEPRDGRVLAVILDLDGLLLDTERVARRTWRCAAAECGYEIDDALYASTIGHTPEDTRCIYMGALGKGFPYARARALQQDHMRQAIEAGQIAQKPGVPELLETIEGLGLQTAVATSSHRSSARRKLAASGLDGLFHTVVCGDDIAHGKPAPDIFLETAARLRVAGQHCVVVEDSSAGVQAAHAAGMRIILVPDLEPPSEASMALAWRTLPSLEEAARFLTSQCAGTAWTP